MFIVLLVLFVPTAVALPLTVERTDNGSIIVSQSVVVSNGKTTNISSSVVIRNSKKKLSYPSAGNTSGVSTRRKGCTADIRTKVTEFVKVARMGATAEVEVGSWDDVFTKTLGTQNKNAKKSTEPSHTTMESFLRAFKQKSSFGISENMTLSNYTNSPRRTWLTTRVYSTSRPGLAAGIARLFWKRNTTKPSKHPIAVPIPASEMLLDSFQIDYGWVNQKRIRRQAFDNDLSHVDNTTIQLEPSHLDNDTKMVLVLLIALLLLALSSLMSYRPSMEKPYCIRLSPGAPLFYQPIPTSECADTMEFKSNLGPNDTSFISLVRTKVLVSRMLRRYRSQASVRQFQVCEPDFFKNHLLVDSVSHPSLQPQSEVSGTEPYTANIVLKDVPQDLRKLLLNVQLQLHQRPGMDGVRSYNKEITFDLS